jgi:signal transduction histidine kinase
VGLNAESVPSTVGSRDATRPIWRIAAVLAGCLLLVCVANILPLVSPSAFMPPVTPPYQAYQLVLWLLWLVVLAESLLRLPSSPFGKVVLVYVGLAQIWTLQYLGNSLLWSFGWAFATLQVAALIHVIVAFPSGRLRSRLDRAIVVAYYAYLIGISVVMALIVEDFGCDPDCVPQAFVVWPNDTLAEFLGYANILPPLVLSPLVIVAVWRHWREANPSRRQVLAPVLVALPIVTVATSLQYLASRFDIGPINDFFNSPLQPIPQFVIPIGFLVSVTRLRLNRGRIADLVVEFGRGIPIGGLRDVLARALGDPTLELAFAAPSGDGFVDGGGRPVELPSNEVTRAVTRLEGDGELLGVLIHDPAIDVEDPGLVEAVGSAARLALENERLAAQVKAQLAEVRESRSRIVEAGDTERRRIERDLHDGAQQRLVALAMRLQTAKQTTAGASALLDEATAELQTAISEVRNLARGLHPPILTEAGLRAAIDSLAERTPIPVTVAIPDRRFPPTVEAIAYFVVAEALTNVVRHADAYDVTVTAQEAGGRLIVTVQDDGRGGADAAKGSGLGGLLDRLAAAGGSLTVLSPVGGGTRIRAEIPIP